MNRGVRIRLFAGALLAACGRPPTAGDTPAPIASNPTEADVPADAAPPASPPSEPRAWQDCRGAPAAAAQVRTIRDVDWCNHEYTPGWVVLRDGIEEIHEYMDLGQPHDTYIFKLADVAYGDVDGDGAEDAAVLIHSESYTGAGSSSGADLFVYTLRNGAPVELGSDPASVAEQWTLVVMPGEVTMRFAIGPKRCVDRWAYRGGKLVYDGATKCTPP